jgi:hypothetical protein
VNMRVGAYMNAVKRVSEAMLIRKRRSLVPMAEPHNIASS